VARKGLGHLEINTCACVCVCVVGMVAETVFMEMVMEVRDGMVAVRSEIANVGAVVEDVATHLERTMS